VLAQLFNAEEIGITLPAEDQLDPEQSTLAIVAHQPLRNILGVRTRHKR
jgi:hypothetical protein